MSTRGGTCRPAAKIGPWVTVLDRHFHLGREVTRVNADDGEIWHATYRAARPPFARWHWIVSDSVSGRTLAHGTAKNRHEAFDFAISKAKRAESAK